MSTRIVIREPTWVFIWGGDYFPIVKLLDEASTKAEIKSFRNQEQEQILSLEANEIFEDKFGLKVIKIELD